ncbi:bZIP transcription factor ABI5 homolog [Phoenix dactylifera]|uniref:BZIP transcription factor ABI5 homolog n=1 Tax=Phoenix dactylifera TaxID=42345 RepID=A0A8B7CRD4_PHODC|nr:bZIP transcription factor ABI5 homolog [Phoenix dactylifera]XP_008804819.1 bZIP transcription factor ABI5 homolog [Phoenix dactylifera]XP_008804821.1 bZIP transcription factor ABI5 homolog [Phoenix dactylifera]XP_017700914.1 bZIP transcription factor ABI5 homolog [Phoenix dactylifera]XP_038972507.1 bZIP transcription factor ABI5 homolog [Phoenix dactylifera]
MASASASESRNVTSEETEVTSERRPEEGKEEREMDLEFPLMRQSSIYSLTLDEIQNTVCEPGKAFGSMNMDEFLTNIWNVEEGQIANAHAQKQPHIGGGGMPAAAPLQRQGSITIPPPLCRKTVDEVWEDIHRDQNARRQNVDGAPPPSQQQQQPQSNGVAHRKRTFGEITLEDFLVKAGIVKEGYQRGSAPSPHAAPVPPATQYGMPAGYQMVGPEGAPVFGHVVGVQAYGDHQVAAANRMYQVVGDGGGPSYALRNGFGGMVGNGYGGGAAVGGSPASPGSSEGAGGGQVDNSDAAEGGGGGKGGRKRALDGTVEKVVERRQRRMIKNRESAARSRARKQAYTVELEAELNQLKEENARLKEEEKKILALKKQLLMEAMAERARVNAQKTILTLRRCNSSQW